MPWSIGTAVLTVGVVTTAFGFTRLATHEALGLTALVGGLLCVVGGMLTFVIAALKVLADDTCIGLRVDGVLYRRGGEVARLVAWEAVDAVRVDGEALIVEVEGGEAWRVVDAFADITAAELAERIRATRRRALMGLPLRPG